ncbi:MAG: hypothetical protein IPP70_07995 [Elusimicrobia bacterium]|nr:hypothetical protein [Elusimicrobiota bacterium]
MEQYTYDANGNRTSGTVGGTTLNGTYDGDDKVAVYGGSAYAHAAGGEWRTVTEGGETTTYDYDAVGNLRGVTLPSGTTLEYVIDGRNRRVGRKVNGTLTQGYLYDGQLGSWRSWTGRTTSRRGTCTGRASTCRSGWRRAEGRTGSSRTIWEAPGWW